MSDNLKENGKFRFTNTNWIFQYIDLSEHLPVAASLAAYTSKQRKHNSENYLLTSKCPRTTNTTRAVDNPYTIAQVLIVYHINLFTDYAFAYKATFMKLNNKEEGKKRGM